MRASKHIGWFGSGLLWVLLCLALSVSAKDINDRLTVTAVTGDDGWGAALRSPSALFYDGSTGELFVVDAANNRVVIYDDQLTAKYSFRHAVTDHITGRRQWGEPRDIVVNSAGEIILIDNLADYVDVLDFRGQALQQIYLDSLLDNDTTKTRPQALAVDAHDNVYLLTAGEISTVLVLNPRMELVRRIGTAGLAIGDFNTPLSISVHEDLLFVSDLYADPAIKVFDTSGTYLHGFAGHDIDRGDVSFPSGIDFLSTDEAELVLVADGLRQSVAVYDREGQFHALIGGFGLGIGEFRYPVDVAVSGDSLLFVLERVGGRIQRFSIGK